MELNSNLVKLSNVQNEKLQNYNESLGIELNKLSVEPNLPSPNNPPWNSGIALLAWFISVALIFIVPTFGILFYIIFKGINPSDGGKLASIIQGDPTAILVNIIFVIPAHILTILVAWLIVTKVKKHPFREMLGWKMGGFNILYLVGIVVGFFILAAIVSYFIPEQDNELLRILKSSRAVVFAIAFMATFTAPLVEEVIYRGILYSAFQRTFGVATAVGLVTLLFALVHVPQYYPSYSTILMICLLSLILTLVRVKSENLLPCIILHTIFNGVQSILLIAEPYLKQLSPENPQPAVSFILGLN